MTVGYNPERNLPRWAALRAQLDERPPSSLADYGSNWGFFSLEAAAAFPEALVVSFEDGGMAHTDDPRFGQAGMLEHHRTEIARRSLPNNLLVPQRISEDWMQMVARAGVRFDAQLVLSFIHWLDLPEADDFARCLRTLLSLARTTLLEMPKCEPHQHNGAQILRWYGADPDPQHLLERITQGLGVTVTPFAPEITYRPFFALTTPDAPTSPERIRAFFA